jgi:agmatine deiminase
MINSRLNCLCTALSITILACSFVRISAQEVQFTMTAEDYTHEGTWIEWPHHYTYGYYYRNSIESTWIDMTSSLIDSEKVHIIVYNESEFDRVYSILMEEGIPLDNVDFYIHPFDDVWVRDNGPIFVLDEFNNLHSLDWGFNGWGYDYPYELDDDIPSLVASSIGVNSIDLNSMVLEGGAIEVDGQGTAMATKSSITHSSRNPNLSEQEIEDYLTTYLGITNMIWLEGIYGLEVTDMHIDGFVKFLNNQSIVTMSADDLEYWGVPSDDVASIFNASNALGVEYDHVLLPLTQSNVSNTFGDNLGYKGSYVNYYVANSVVLVPNYNDVNDNVANQIIAGLYPNKTVIGIDVRNLYENGGMIHCVTQQQPFSESFTGVHFTDVLSEKEIILYPNPANDHLRIMNLSEEIERVELYNSMGQLQYSTISTFSNRGSLVLLPETLAVGVYQIHIYSNSEKIVRSLRISK